MKKQLVSAALCALLALNSGIAITASADWHSNDSGYYYTDDETGERYKSGWHTIDYVKYYFDKDGYSVRGLKKIDGKYYYFKNNKRGGIATGWQTINGSRYYFGKNGVMSTGWKTIDGDRYYFKPSGKMAVGKTKINGKTYTFGTDGKYKSSNSSASSKKADWVEFDKDFTKQGIYFDMKNTDVTAALGKPDVHSSEGDNEASIYFRDDASVGFIFTKNKLIGVIYSYPPASDVTASDAQKRLESNGYELLEEISDTEYAYFKKVGKDILVATVTTNTNDGATLIRWDFIAND